eukprot:1881668-Amphidinium_carterae.1
MSFLAKHVHDVNQSIHSSLNCERTAGNQQNAATSCACISLGFAVRATVEQKGTELEHACGRELKSLTHIPEKGPQIDAQHAPRVPFV